MFDVEAFIDRVEMFNGSSPDMLKESVVQLAREYQGYAEKGTNQPDEVTRAVNYMRDNLILGNPEREKYFSIGYEAGIADAPKREAVQPGEVTDE